MHNTNDQPSCSVEEIGFATPSAADAATTCLPWPPRSEVVLAQIASKVDGTDTTARVSVEPICAVSEASQ